MGSTRPALLAGLAAPLIFAAGPALADAPDPTPVVVHDPLSRFAKGEVVTIKARIRSPVGKQIFSPTAFVKGSGLKPTRVPLQPVAGEVDTYAAQVPASLAQGDFEYFVEAFDEDGNGPGRIGSPAALIKVRAVSLAPAERDAAELASAPAPDAARPWKRTAGIAGVSGGGALIAGALACGGLGLSAKRDMERAGDDAQYDAAKRRGQRLAVAANVLGAAGAVAAGAGAALLWLSARRDEGRGAQVGVAPGPGGPTVLIAGHF